MVSRLADLEKAAPAASDQAQDRGVSASNSASARFALAAVRSVAPFLIRKPATTLGRKATKAETLKKLLLLCGSLVFMLVLTEGTLRLFPLLRPLPRTYVGEYENRPGAMNWCVRDAVLGWRMGPFKHSPLYETNSQGFRAPSDFAFRPDCKEIVFAGDSITFGVKAKYENTFASLTQAGLPGTCAYNMGLPGFGLDQIWLTVRTQALPLHPRLVVVTFTSSNFARSEEAYRSTEGFNKPVFKLVDGQLVPKTPRDRPNSFVRFFEHHSSLWRVGRLADRTLAHRYPHGEWWYLNAAILDAIRDDCRKSEVPVLFVYIPSRAAGPFPSLRGYMSRNHANFTDLSQGEFALAPDMFIPGGDLNDKGNRQVSDAIQRRLKQDPPIWE
jgi:hypothetical protein